MILYFAYYRLERVNILIIFLLDQFLHSILLLKRFYGLLNDQHKFLYFYGLRYSSNLLEIFSARMFDSLPSLYKEVPNVHIMDGNHIFDKGHSPFRYYSNYSNFLVFLDLPKIYVYPLQEVSFDA